jgi:hypothetical protein
MNKHLKELKDIIAADPLDAFISVVFFIAVMVVAGIFLYN